MSGLGGVSGVSGVGMGLRGEDEMGRVVWNGFGMGLRFVWDGYGEQRDWSSHDTLAQASGFDKTKSRGILFRASSTTGCEAP
jgi:hypothetical protein